MDSMTVADIENRLSDIADRIRRLILLRGITSSLVLALFLGTSLIFLDALFRPGALILLTLIPILLSVLIMTVYTGTYRPLSVIRDPVTLAKYLERLIPSFHGRLVAAVEERGGDIPGKWGYSEVLRTEAVRIAGSLLRRLNPGVVQRRLGLPDHYGSGPAGALGIVCLLLLAAGIFFSWPVPLTSSIERVTHPLALYRAERTWDLEVHPGNIRLMKGDELTVEIRTGQVDRALSPVVYVESGGEWTPCIPREESGGNSYRLEFGKVESRFRYYVGEKKRKSPVYGVQIIEPPSVTALRFRIESPDYTGLPPAEVTGDARDLYALRGAALTLTGRVNRHLDRSWLLFSGGEEIELRSIDDRELLGTFLISEADSFQVVVIDTSGIRGGGSHFYRIHVLDDREPEVRLVIPGEDRELDREMEELLRFRAADDFGLLDLNLQYTIESRSGDEKGSGMNSLGTFGGTILDTVVDFRWDLKGLALFPGDRVRYRGRIRDNDGIDGPKSGWSRRFVFTLPTMAEVFGRRQREMEETAGGIRELVEETARLKEAIESLERDLIASGGADWEGRQEASEVLKKQEEILGELKAMTNRFREGVEKPNRETPVSSRLLERAQEVSELFREVATPEMMAAMEKLREALEKIDPALVEKALEELEFSEEEMLKGLEKTLKALKQMQIEQGLESLVQEASDLLDRQEAVNRELEEKEDSRAERLRREEELISADVGHLMGGMDRVSDELEEAGEAATARELGDLSEEVGKRGLEQRLGEMASAVERGDYQGAAARGEESAGDMRYLKDRLSEIREDLIEKWRRGIADIIDRAISDLLALSSSQEELYRKLPGPDEPFPFVDSFVTEQYILMEGLEGVAENLFRSSEETFFVGRDVGRGVGSALHRMRIASRQLESGEPLDDPARNQLKGAMSSLNGAVLALMRDRKSMNASSSGAGLEEAFRQMMELARAQAELNEKTSGFFPMPFPGQPGEGLSINEQLLQMAAEQSRIQKGLESLESSFPGRTGAFGSIDPMIEEMEGVAGDLKRGNVDEKTIDRQRRILSRLLDAEKSIREKDYTRERQAEKPEPYRASSPLPLPPEVFREEDLSTRSMVPMARGSYPEGYREIIRAYFRELMKGAPQEVDR